MKNEDQEKEQGDGGQQQPSSVDRANDLINKARDARNLYRGLKGANKALKGARGAAAAARGTAAIGQVVVATSEIWAPILLIFAAFIIIVVLISAIVTVISTENITQQETYTCASAGGTCSASSACQSPNALDLSASCSASLPFCCAPPYTGTFPVPDCTTVDARLREDFGVVVQEEKETVSCANRQKLYSIYSIPFKSRTYKSYLRPNQAFTIYFYPPKESGCTTSGFTPSTTKIYTYGLARFLNCASLKSAGRFVLHETGHIIGQRNYTLFYQQFPLSNLLNADPGCFRWCDSTKKYMPKTYSLCSTIPANETFAEFSSLYVHNSKDGKYGDIDDFKTECNDSWNYYYRGLFGGTMF